MIITIDKPEATSHYLLVNGCCVRCSEKDFDEHNDWCVIYNHYTFAICHREFVVTRHKLLTEKQVMLKYENERYSFVRN